MPPLCTRMAQAMRIVRTIGQAFEVCHKLSLAYNNNHAKEINSSPITGRQQNSVVSSPTKDGFEARLDSGLEQRTTITSPETPTTPLSERGDNLNSNNNNNNNNLNDTQALREFSALIKSIELKLDLLSNRMDKLEVNQEKLLNVVEEIKRKSEDQRNESGGGGGLNCPRTVLNPIPDLFSSANLPAKPDSLFFQSPTKDSIFSSSGISSQTSSPPSAPLSLLSPPPFPTPKTNSMFTDLFASE